LINTWDKVKYNKEYLKFVSKNAREWFIRNSTLDKSLEHTFKKINLEKIK
jgi:hypothetical protein